MAFCYLEINVQKTEKLCKKERIFIYFRITELLKGKGAFKNGKFQGKAGDLGGINKCKKLIEEYFNKSE